MKSADPVPHRVATANPPARDILMLGLGNILAGDEGVGIHVLNTLEKYPALNGVTLIDGGTGGVSLLQPIANSPIAIVIAAARDGKPGGAVSVLRPRAIRELPAHVCAVESGLQDLFAAAALLGPYPEVHLFTVSVDETPRVSMALSAPVAAAVEEVARLAETFAMRLLALNKDIPE